jgi:N-acyl homoserine lactone hydrolase
MKRAKYLLLAGILAGATITRATPVQATAEVTLTRLDCGKVMAADANVMSDTYAYEGQSKLLVDSCYLIKHGDEYMLWDTGLPSTLKNTAPMTTRTLTMSLSVTLLEQLATLSIKPEQIKYIGISHYHFDHTGQAANFPSATLLIGKGDWDALTSNPPAIGVNAGPLMQWIQQTSKVEPVPGDKDIFGDGTVVMLSTPGHTPGHHSLLLRLQKMGVVLLTGDAVHSRENYQRNGVTSFNVNRADTLASISRIKDIATNLKATVIIQHEARDVSKLPAFPNAAH